jgi:hypothetical protein
MHQCSFQHILIIFSTTECLSLGKASIECCVWLCNTYWNKAVGQAVVYKWCRPIKKAQQLLKDSLQTGTPVTTYNKTAFHAQENKWSVDEIIEIVNVCIKLALIFGNVETYWSTMTMHQSFGTTVVVLLCFHNVLILETSPLFPKWKPCQ